MTRPREFVAEKALEKAMHLFWDKGYQAASLVDLTRAMGLSKSSFYDTFGSKHELFLSAIEHYRDTVTALVVERLESSAPAREAIEGVFKFIVGNAVDQGDRRGCFLCNCAAEVSPHDPQAGARVAEALKQLEEAYYNAIRRGQSAGEIPSGRDARALARYLTSSANGLVLMSKATPDRAVLEDIVRIVMEALE